MYYIADRHSCRTISELPKMETYDVVKVGHLAMKLSYLRIWA
jgi:hypothetical protein